MFVSFEGIDGSGKSTQAARLVERLKCAGHDVVATREPGGTPLGERVRDVLLGDITVSPWAEAALFAAARAQLVADVIEPALERQAWVVIDRFLDSSLAYQGGARGLGIDPVLELNRAVMGGLEPERTFLMRVPVEIALARCEETRGDRIEAEGPEFFARVDRAFEALSARFERIEPIDGTQLEADIADQIAASLGVF